MRRRGIGHRLNRTLQHWREQSEPDGSGGQVTVWVELGPVRCRVSQPTAAERMLAAQAGAAQTQPVYLSPDTEVRRGDELRDTGETWRVTATYYPSVRIYVRADCELIQAEGSQ